MISPELRKQIFLSIPLSFDCSEGTVGVHKEYAPFAKVTEYLKQYPKQIFIAIDFVDDEIYRDETPCNYVFNYGQNITQDDSLNPTKPITMEVGTRNRTALNLHIYATWQPNYQNTVLLLEEILNKLHFWVIFDLEKIVDYAHVESIQSIDETEDRILHRVISCSFVYTNTISREVDVINDIDYTIKKVAPPPEEIFEMKIRCFQDQSI